MGGLTLRIERLVLREVEMKLRQPFQSSLGRIHSRRFVIVEAHAQGEIGYGEATVLSAPIYNEETPVTAWHVLESFLIPLTFQAGWETPQQLAAVMRSVRGHHMAKAALEGAVWDLAAKLAGMPLWRYLGGVQNRVAAGAAVGLQQDTDALIRQVGEFLEQGYRRIKIKIGPGHDELPLRALRNTFGSIPLAVDANSAYTLANTVALQRLDDFDLQMIEQPLPAADLVGHARLQQNLRTDLCLDESIISLEHAQQALALGSCRVINIKIGRVGGLSEARRIHELCSQEGIPVWCGGMLESGIGRAHNIALATLPNFTLPGDLSASHRYWFEDVIEPEIEIDADGFITPSSHPGIGYQVRRKFLDSITLRSASFTPAEIPHS